MFVSPLDKNYTTLRHAAILIAREQAGIEPDTIMEIFKHAIFTYEFEREEIAVPGQEASEILNLLLLHIEAPPTQRTVSGLPPEQQPQELFAVKGMTVAEVLSERDALPGKAGNWPMFDESPHNLAALDDAMHDLARIPFPAFPAKARDILGNIMLSKAKLRRWMLSKNYELPSFLKDALPASEGPAIQLPEAPANEPASDAARGRPRKPGWLRIEQLVRDMHAANPYAKRGALAFDARKKATEEFNEKDLPSVETILRHMKTILRQAGRFTS